MSDTSRRRLSAAATLAGCALLAACAGAPQKPAAAARADVNALVERWFDESLELDPIVATFLGERRGLDRLGDPASLEYHAAREALATLYLEEALAIDPAALDGQQRLTHEMFVRSLRLELRGRTFPGELLPVSQIGNLGTTLAVLGSGASAQPFRTREDHEAWLRRAAGFPQWVDSAIARMREGLARGVTQPRPTVASVLAQIDALVVDAPEESVFWSPVRMLPEDLPPAYAARLEDEYRALIAGALMPAYRRLRDFVADEYLPGARESVGWSALPDGERWYAHAVEVQTTLAMDPHEIHALGLEEVARIRGEMESVKRQVGFEGDLQAFFEFLKEDPRFYYEREEDLLEGYRALKARIDPELPRLFSRMPKADYEVRAVEPFRARSAAGASYQPPSVDGTRPGIFYVNTYNLRAQPKFGMETLSLHEAAPGHHFQVTIQQELTELPRFRRFDRNVAYVEGWALYAETLGHELGLFTDPYQYYGKLSDEMLRAMRLVVDTGLHVKGWSRQQAIDYMLANSSLAESDVVAEVERYIVWPAQALGYKLGQLRISALRARAERELGSRFDVREFHDEILRDGSLPLEVLEAKIDRWIASRR